MSRFAIFVLCLVCCLIVSGPGEVLAYSGIMSSWQSYYQPCNDLTSANCNACHQNGFNFNSYGEALRVRIADLGMTNTEAFQDAEAVDSDGDGFTNGQEIVVDCTLPWDAGSAGVVAVESLAWERVKALYR